MKKFLIFCVFITLGFIAYFYYWYGFYSYVKGDQVVSYSRFMLKSDNTEQFNLWGLISPKQAERQHIILDTISFNHKVIYPCGKNFLGENSDNFIAGEITRSLLDSIVKIEIKTRLDYDLTSLSVRNYKNPSIKKVKKPYVSNLSLIGFASPEWATGYGYKQSIQPGHIEKENILLAKERLYRVSKILDKKGFNIKSQKISEIQLSKKDLEFALKDRTILDKMRYVEAKGNIIVERLEISTITLPILGPLWIFLGILIVFGFIQAIKFLWNKLNKSFDKGFYIIGTIIIPIIIVIGIIIVLSLLIFAIINGLFLPLIFVIVIIILLLFREKIINFLLINIGFIIYLIERFCNWIHKEFKIFKVWWKSKDTSDQILYFLIPYSIIITILAIYLLVK